MERLSLAGLVEFNPPFFSGARERRFFLTEEIHALIAGQAASKPEFPCADADFEIGKFIRGNIVGVSRTHRSKAELKWLTNLPEIWVYCFRKPSPGWRLFGRFVRKNVFVGLHCVPREVCGDLVGYAKQAEFCVQIWENLFPNEDPFTAGNFESYLGEMVVER
jgi:hypothetical protein